MRTATWENIGTDVQNSKTLNEVLANAKLDFEVETKPLYYGNNILVPDKVATVRKDNEQLLGVVGKDYKLYQNKDAFDFVNYINEDVQFVKAGMTYTGMVYIIARLPQMNILNDGFQPYVIFKNGFNGIYSLQASICPLRIVCTNQFNIAFKQSPNSISIRHSINMASRMEDAKKVMESTAHYMLHLKDESERYAMTKLSAYQVDGILNEVFELPKNATERKATNIIEAREQFLNIYNNNDNQNFKGTAWGMINAYSDFVTHKEPGRKTENIDEATFMSVTFNPAVFKTFMDAIERVRA